MDQPCSPASDCPAPEPAVGWSELPLGAAAAGWAESNAGLSLGVPAVGWAEPKVVLSPGAPAIGWLALSLGAAAVGWLGLSLGAAAVGWLGSSVGLPPGVPVADPTGGWTAGGGATSVTVRTGGGLVTVPVAGPVTGRRGVPAAAAVCADAVWTDTAG